MRIKHLITCLFVILISNNVFSQNDKSLIDYIQKEYHFKIGDSLPDKVLNETFLTIKFISISDLKVLKLFPKLNSLRLYECSVTSIKNMPDNIKSLMIDDGSVSLQLVIPPNIQRLTFCSNKTTFTPILPKGLIELNLNDNNLTSIPEFPEGLTDIMCSRNALTKLPALPQTLINLYCDNNYLAELPPLPPHLVMLNCANNQIKKLKNVPPTIQTLNCQSNNIETMDSIHAKHLNIDIRCNPIKKIPIDFTSCEINITPQFYRPSTDYRQLVLKHDFNCRKDLKKFCFNLYKSLINYDIDYFNRQLLSEKDFDWMGNCFQGDSLNRITDFNYLIHDDLNPKDIKPDFLKISDELGLSFIDSIAVFPRNMYYKCDFIFERVVLYCSNIFNYPSRTLTFDVVESPQGFKIYDIPSQFYNVAYNKDSKIAKDSFPDKMPDDFEFTIQADYNYSYDSKSGIYYKPLTCHLTLLEVSLTHTERQAIYDKIKKLYMYERPIITVEHLMDVVDEESDGGTITINVNGQQERIQSCSSNFKDKEYCIKLQALFKEIETILLSKENVKKAPPTHFFRI